jgi:hypothetical protein
LKKTPQPVPNSKWKQEAPSKLSKKSKAPLHLAAPNPRKRQPHLRKNKAPFRSGAGTKPANRSTAVTKSSSPNTAKCAQDDPQDVRTQGRTSSGTEAIYAHDTQDGQNGSSQRHDLCG